MWYIYFSGLVEFISLSIPFQGMYIVTPASPTLSRPPPAHPHLALAARHVVNPCPQVCPFSSVCPLQPHTPDPPPPPLSHPKSPLRPATPTPLHPSAVPPHLSECARLGFSCTHRRRPSVGPHRRRGSRKRKSHSAASHGERGAAPELPRVACPRQRARRRPPRAECASASGAGPNAYPKRRA